MLYRTFHSDLPDYSIRGLVEKFALEGPLLAAAGKACPANKLGYHNAMFDALATCILLKNLAAELRRSGTEPSDEFLLEYSRPARI
jgi:hypothetical protein